jgi:hypothetical protein
MGLTLGHWKTPDFEKMSISMSLEVLVALTLLFIFGLLYIVETMMIFDDVSKALNPVRANKDFGYVPSTPVDIRDGSKLLEVEEFKQRVSTQTDPERAETLVERMYSLEEVYLIKHRGRQAALGHVTYQIPAFFMGVLSAITLLMLGY